MTNADTAIVSFMGTTAYSSIDNNNALLISQVQRKRKEKVFHWIKS
jgi:hypothetical protein